MKDSLLRRKAVLHLCAKLGCDIETLLKEHNSELSHNMRTQALFMYREKHGRHYRVDES
jgi:hypothetical protein